jgi:valyl-tRNA synthetase
MKGLSVNDKKILRQLTATQKSVLKDINALEFGNAAHTIYDFFWHQFCDQYIESAKETVGDNKITQQVLIYTLFSSLKLLHPFVPFLTEELYQLFPMKKKEKSLMIERLPRI